MNLGSKSIFHAGLRYIVQQKTGTPQAASRQPGIPPDFRLSVPHAAQPPAHTVQAAIKIMKFEPTLSTVHNSPSPAWQQTMYSSLSKAMLEDMSLPITHCNYSQHSVEGKRSYKIRAELEQSINLLRTTRNANVLAVLSEMLKLMFH